MEHWIVLFHLEKLWLLLFWFAFVRKGVKVFIRNSGQNLVIAVTLMVFCTGTFAETIVYKWFDENGVVHFGDAPPDKSTSADTLIIPKAPPAPAQPSTNSPAASIRVALWPLVFFPLYPLDF